MTWAAVAADELATWGRLDADGRRERVRMYWMAERQRTNWCAAFTMWLRSQAGLRYAIAGRPVRGARAAVRHVAEWGQWVVAPGEARDLDARVLVARLQPGDVVCWRRGRLSWTAHVGTVTERDGALTVGVEGNVGGAVHEFRLTSGELNARLKGLYGVARAE